MPLSREEYRKLSVAEKRQYNHDEQLLQNSIERVINTTIKILEGLHNARMSINKEDMSTNLQDWYDLKETTVAIWNDARNEAFKRRNK